MSTPEKEFALQKLRSCHSLAKSLLEGDWPYSDAREALNEIERDLSKELAELEALEIDTSTEVLAAHCRSARAAVSRNKPYMGFILRSSNLRNGFEAYSPLRKICTKFLGDVRIIIGSEWIYSPFVYPAEHSHLANCIFVGLPASEAQNALLTPVAGHELGHVVWRKEVNLIQEVFDATAQTIITNWNDDDVRGMFPKSTDPQTIATDLDLRSKWVDSHRFALRQCEEIFADCIAVWIFGESFAHAFRYLLAPDTTERLSERYPTNRDRAAYIKEAGDEYGYELEEFEHLFIKKDPQRTTLRIADLTTRSLAPSLISKAREICTAAGVQPPSRKGKAQALSDLRLLQPSYTCSIADILNAAWSIRFDLANWNIQGVDGSRKLDILNDLVFKSFEVHEWSSILGKAR